MNHIPNPHSVELSVVVPMHNSETVIEQTLKRWVGKFSSGNHEIILVENGSQDDTWKIAKALSRDTKNIRFITLQSNKGLGNAYSAGIAASSGNKILLSADDLPFDFADLEAVEKLSVVPPIVIGSKAHKDSTVERGFLRKAFTRGYKFARFLILGSRIGDTQGTFFVDGDWLRKVNPLLNEPGFLFTTQLVVLAEKMDVDILEVPVTLSDDHAPKQSTVRWSDVIKMATGLIELRKFQKLPNVSPEKNQE